MKKRVLGMLLVLVMFVSLVPVSVLAYPSAYSLPALTGNQAADTANIAKSQLGYSGANGTEYGAWWNGVTNWGVDYTYSGWCAMFVCWCANKAGAGLGIAYDKNGASPELLFSWLKNNAQYCTSFSKQPTAGDFVFFGYGSNTAHVAIVTSFDSSSNRVYFVGGNQGYSSGGEVTSSSCSWASGADWGGQTILGYGRPNYGGSSSSGPSTPSLSVSERTTHEYRVTIPANYILKNYTSETDTNAQSKNYVLARDSAYRLACEEKVVLSDGTVRYKWLSGDTPPKTLWFNYDSSIMSVSPKHNYDDYGYEAAHPHKYYYKCSCGDYYYTGETATVSSCSKCYPAEANVKLYDGYGYMWDKSAAEIGKNYTLPYSYPEKSGYYFCGWSYEQYDDEYDLRPGDKIKVESDISLYPVYVSHSKATSGDVVFIYDISDFDDTNYNVQKKTVSTETRVDNSYWTSWSDYRTDRIYESSNVEVRTKLMYRYYYFLCPYCGAHEPFWGTSDCGQTIPSSAWHETWSTVPYSESNYKTFSYTSSKYYTTSIGDGQLWCFSSGNLNDDYDGAIDATGSASVVETGYSYREYIESYTTKTTSRTGYIITPAHTHSYTSSVTSPTCTSGGYTTYTCSCGDSYTGSYTDALGHNYANGVCTRCGAKDPNYVPPKVSFTDVSTADYCYDAVQWAVANGITNGTGNNTFSPDKSCSRAEVVTFLWRAAGEPSASATVNFTDVKPTDYFYKAVQWAVENKITTGAGNNTFLPNNICTRSQVVTFLWRANGSPIVSGGGFADVASSAYYCDAVRWAVSGKITTGTGNGQFSPDALCTRGQVVTFLFRAK